MLLLRFDAAGNLLWGKQSGGTDTDRALDVLATVDGIYTTGTFRQEANFGSKQLSSMEGAEVFLAKYNFNGDVIWARQSRGGKSEEDNSLALAADGDVLLTGLYTSQIVLENDTLSSATAQKDFFIARYDAAGNYVGAAASGLTPGSSMQNPAIAYGPDNKIYLTGALYGTAYGFTARMYDIFYGVFDEDLAFRGGALTGGAGVDNGKAIAADNAGGIYITGSFMQSVNFTGAGTLSGANDMFFGRIFGEGGTSLTEFSPPAEVGLFPVPATTWLCVSGAEPASTVSIYSLSGVKVAECTTTDVNTVIGVSHLAPGLYMIRAGSWSGLFSKE